MTETSNEKVGGFGVGGDVKVQTSKVGKFSRRYGTTVCEFKEYEVSSWGRGVCDGSARTKN